MTETVLLPGTATLADLEAIYRGGGGAIRLDRAAKRGVDSAAARIAEAASGSEAVYGVNTGFGKLASVKIDPADTATLQRNLILSHCSGVGEPSRNRDRPADDGAEAALARARRVRRALGADRADRGDARQGRRAGRAVARARSARPAIWRRSRTWRR